MQPSTTPATTATTPATPATTAPVASTPNAPATRTPGGPHKAAKANAAQAKAAQALATAPQYVRVAYKVAQARHNNPGTRNVALTMPQWATACLPALGYASTPAQCKRVGKVLRGYAGRNPGCGVGRGSQYPPTTPQAFAALLGLGVLVGTAATPAQAASASGKARTLWAKAGKAASGQAATAKRNA